MYPRLRWVDEIPVRTKRVDPSPLPTTQGVYPASSTRRLRATSLVVESWGRGGNEFRGNVVGNMLRRPRYVGHRTHEKQIVSSGDWEPTVGQDTFDQAMAILSAPGRRHSRGLEPKHLLSGIAAHQLLAWCPLNEGAREWSRNRLMNAARRA
jgi:hypothetical protein